MGHHVQFCSMTLFTIKVHYSFTFSPELFFSYIVCSIRSFWGCMKKLSKIERLDKLLANSGYCSRRGCGPFLLHNSVIVCGNRMYDGSTKVPVADIRINSQPIDHPEGIFILINKPAGYICSHEESEGTLIYSLLPGQWMNRHPQPSTIGRLDKDTTGALLITDQPHLNHHFTAPRKKIEKVYVVEVATPLSEALIQLFGSGTLMLSGEKEPCLPAQLTINSPFCAEITLYEGRYHQVKRMFLAAGYAVTRLHRSRFGPFSVASLPEGSYQDLPLPVI